MALRRPLPFLKGDPTSNARDRTPQCGVEKPSQGKEEVTIQNKMVNKSYPGVQLSQTTFALGLFFSLGQKMEAVSRCSKAAHS